MGGVPLATHWGHTPPSLQAGPECAWVTVITRGWALEGLPGSGLGRVVGRRSQPLLPLPRCPSRPERYDDPWKYDPRFTGSFDDDPEPHRDPYGDDADRRSVHSEHSARSLRSAPSVHSRHSSFSAHSQQVGAGGRALLRPHGPVWTRPPHPELGQRPQVPPGFTGNWSYLPALYVPESDLQRPRCDCGSVRGPAPTRLLPRGLHL